MKLKVTTTAGKAAGTVDAPDDLFGIEPNVPVMHQVVTAQLAGRRRGTHATKSRARVSGGGIKPWKQKGTGRARQGSIRASHWVGGGKAMGPKPRDYAYDVPKKVRKAALRAALALRGNDKKLLIVEKWEPTAPRTATAAKVLAKLGASKALVVDAGQNLALARSLRNLDGHDFLAVEGLNVYDILKHDALVLTAATARKIEEALS